MKHEAQTNAIDKALAYLASRNALHKLAQPCPIIGRDICIWMPARQSSLAFTLPPMDRAGAAYRYPIG